VNRATLLSLSKDDLVDVIVAQAAQIAALTARIDALEARLSVPPKTPGNSSTPPSKGQKSNLPDRPKKPCSGRPGITRALAEHPDRTIDATLATCPHCAHALDAADQSDTHAYDHIDLPAISPTITRINRHRVFAPAAAGVSPRRHRRGSSLSRRSDQGCVRWSSICTSPRRSASSASPVCWQRYSA
jgi:hypothetical protein